MNDPQPLPGTLWRHRKGGLYRVVCCAIREDDLTPVVVYRNVVSDVTWTRPLAEFTDGRFTRVQKAKAEKQVPPVVKPIEVPRRDQQTDITVPGKWEEHGDYDDGGRAFIVRRFVGVCGACGQVGGNKCGVCRDPNPIWTAKMGGGHLKLCYACNQRGGNHCRKCSPERDDKAWNLTPKRISVEDYRKWQAGTCSACGKSGGGHCPGCSVHHSDM